MHIGVGSSRVKNRHPAAAIRKYDVHPNQIQGWKKRLAAEAGSLVESGRGQAASDQESKIAELHAKTSELTMERDFLSKAFGRGQ